MLNNVCIVVIKAGANNSIISLLNLDKQLVTWVSCGSVGFGGAKRSSIFAIQVALKALVVRAKHLGYSHAVFVFQGNPVSVVSLLAKVAGLGIHIVGILDRTGLKHNGCKAPKMRRI